MKQTFVYPYMAQLAQGQELKWSIRSLAKFCKFDFDIVVVGDKPDWYTGKHIPTGKVRGVDFAKAHDIHRKLKAIIESDLVPADFIYIYDDIYCINDCQFSDFQKVIAMDYLQDSPLKSLKHGGSQKWMKLLNDTRKALKMEHAYSYETHLPRMFNKQHLGLVMDSYNVMNKPLLISTLYYNELFEQPDVILINDNKYKAGVYQRMTIDSIRNICKGKLWLNNSQSGWSTQLNNFLAELLPERSIFEA